MASGLSRCFRLWCKITYFHLWCISSLPIHWILRHLICWLGSIFRRNPYHICPSRFNSICSFGFKRLNKVCLISDSYCSEPASSQVSFRDCWAIKWSISLSILSCWSSGFAPNYVIKVKRQWLCLSIEKIEYERSVIHSPIETLVSSATLVTLLSSASSDASYLHFFECIDPVNDALFPCQPVELHLHYLLLKNSSPLISYFILMNLWNHVLRHIEEIITRET